MLTRIFSRTTIGFYQESRQRIQVAIKNAGLLYPRSASSSTCPPINSFWRLVTFHLGLSEKEMKKPVDNGG